MASGFDDPFVTPRRPPNPSSSTYAEPPLTRSQASRTIANQIEDTTKHLELVGDVGEKLRATKQRLMDRLKEVEDSKGDELSPDLRQQLEDLQREYDDVGRESTRAFSASASKSAYLASAYDTPSKEGHLGIPDSPSYTSTTPGKTPTSRKQRNQPNRLQDIQFATDIGHNLIVTVRQLQNLLNERDEKIKLIEMEKSKLEFTTEQQESRLKMLDESEQRYKEENWNLELNLQDMRGAASASKDAETRLASQLNIVAAEKESLVKEMYEIKQNHAKEMEASTSSHKTTEMELASMKRNMTINETERAALKRKIDELSTELEESQKDRARLRHDEYHSENTSELGPQDVREEDDTPENSPPPSPNKATPRHAMLETETLKSSLHHAHRMITSLKSTIHREKTEKQELRRMLQDARDDLEQARVERASNASGSTRRKRNDDGKFKKPLRPPIKMGDNRKTRTDVTMIGDDDWEDHESVRGDVPQTEESGADRFDTAAESSAFETANEHEAETTDFQTGAESMAESTGEDTETETPFATPGANGVSDPFLKPITKPNFGSRPGSDRGSQKGGSSGRGSMRSRIELNQSDESDEDAFGTIRGMSQQRLKLRINRGGRRGVSDSGLFMNRGPMDSVENTPPSAIQASGGRSLFAELGGQGNSSVEGTPQSAVTQASRSLFAELADLSGNSDDELVEPQSATIEPVKRDPVTYAETGVMTEPMEEKIREVEKVVTVFVDKPVEVEKIVEVQVEKIVERVVEVPVEKIVEKPVEVFVDKPVDRIVEVIVEKPVEVEKIVEVPVEKIVERIVEVPVDRIVEVPVEKIVEREVPVEKIVTTVITKEVPVEVIVEKIVEKEVPVERIVEVEKIVDREVPVEKIVEREVPVEKIVEIERIVEKRVEVPVEVIVEKIVEKEVPVDRIVDREVPVETIVEKRVEVPVEVFIEKIVEKEVPVERIVEVEKIVEREVPVEKIVEVEKIVDREVPVEKIVERIVEVPVEIEKIIEREVPVDRIVEVPVEKIVERVVEVPVERIVEKVVEVPVDRIVEVEKIVVKEVPVERIVEGEKPLQSRDSSHSGLVVGGIAGLSLGAAAAAARRQVPHIATDETATTSPTSSQMNGKGPLREISGNLNSESGSVYGDMDKGKRIALETFRPNSNGSIRSRGASIESLRRPPSANSMRTLQNAPPLPLNADEKIAAHRTGSGSMGPPLAPASVSRNSIRYTAPTLSPVSTRTADISLTPKARQMSGRSNDFLRSNVSSPVPTRRSSVSSFASDLDERFQMQRNPLPGIGRAGDQTNDPRLIQAITQTMIGEYMWKYTRNMTRSSLSSNRHRRFFWVHPYTKTLYWSDNDPSTAGVQSSHKSVSIEGLKVETDDNPQPPGLHRKSLLVYAPDGKVIKFTAPTGQRHETWLNALSYLMEKSMQAIDNEEAPADEVSASMHDDTREFDPMYSTATVRQAPSLSSYNSRTTQASVTPTKPPVTKRQVSQASQQTVQSQGSMSRLSNIFRSAAPFNSLRGSRSASRATFHSIYDASEVNDSAEDLRQEYERQDRERERLENVRECCDGAHNVGSLPRRGAGRRSSQSARNGTHTHHHHNHVHTNQPASPEIPRATVSS
ncbi:hypothetical protein TWF694_008198 [Orbilia ellipsospora]|uniref:PH domain-containing protein n=1 Tax=Orbilia ellipsospora TaxID=2528407 RepID=A0AAV9XI19_9PEZI